MQKSHVEKLFLEWMEKKLSQKKMIQVETHLKACTVCHQYYQKMSEIFEKPDFSVLEKLQPDPYVPTRINALSNKEKKYTSREKYSRGFRFSPVGAILIIAVCIGIFFGNRLFQFARQDDETQLVNAYYQAIAQQTISDRWDYLFEAEGEEQQ